MRLFRWVQAFVDKNGRPYHYFRRPGSPRIRLPGLPGSVEFLKAYSEALGSAPAPIGREKRSLPGSVSAAIAAYYGSQSFRSLTMGTPAKRRAILEAFREKYGDKPLQGLPKPFIVALLDTPSPHSARNWIKALRHFLRWATEREFIKDDPTLGIRLSLPKSDGHHSWTDDELSQFEGFYPIGSKERLSLALGLYTAQRRGDVVRLGPQHIREGIITIRQAKTGASLAIPVHPELQAAIEATPTGHLTLSHRRLLLMMCLLKGLRRLEMRRKAIHQRN